MKRISILFLQAVTVLIALGAFALLVWEPQVEGVNANATNFEIYFTDPFLALVYLGSIPFFVALYQVFKLLGYARQEKIFSAATAKAFRTIRYCAFAIIGFVVTEEIFILLNHGNDDSAGAIAMGLCIMFLSAIVAAAAVMLEHIVRAKSELASEMPRN